jgi:DNA uptake protein ComE-like DNA-binding protein
MSRLCSRLVTVALAVALVAPGCGLLHWPSFHLPFLHRSAAPETPAPIDLNGASRRKIEKLPGITPTMAQRIVDGRPYDDPNDLVTRGILTQRELERILDRVTVPGRAR